MTIFPTDEWLQSLSDKLNADKRYGRIARNWEADLRVIIEPTGSLEKELWVYLDLWHGKCRNAYFEVNDSHNDPQLILTGKFDVIKKVLLGDLDVMQALLTRRLSVKANMGLLMRNVPVVLDFVRCAKEVTDDTIY
jgi:putative sterol carrier protein